MHSHSREASDEQTPDPDFQRSLEAWERQVQSFDKEAAEVLEHQLAKLQRGETTEHLVRVTMELIARMRPEPPTPPPPAAISPSAPTPPPRHGAQHHAKMEPLLERLRGLLDKLPEEEKRQGLSLSDLQPRLRGRQRGRAASHCELGDALRTLGWTRRRLWSERSIGPVATRWYPPRESPIEESDTKNEAIRAGLRKLDHGPGQFLRSGDERM